MAKKTGKKKARRPELDWGGLDEEDLDEMIEEALEDARDLDEACSGFCQMIEEELSFPFRTKVLGVEVEVTGVRQRETFGLAFECRAGACTQDIDVLDLPLTDPAPEGARWVYAYRSWGGIL